jgi:hypothetical protein
MSGRTRMALALAVVLVCGVAAAIAIAQDSGTGAGAPASAPADTTTTSDIPEGPEVDFCPTPEQTEEHLKLYGFDYKPTVACTREGKVQSPPAEDPAEPKDSDEGLTEAEAEQREKEGLLSARPLPSDGDTCTIDGEYPNGEKVDVWLMGTCPKEEITPAEFARGVFGP